jgi:hypothetical protein
LPRRRPIPPASHSFSNILRAASQTNIAERNPEKSPAFYTASNGKSPMSLG